MDLTDKETPKFLQPLSHRACMTPPVVASQMTSKAEVFLPSALPFCFCSSAAASWTLGKSSRKVAGSSRPIQADNL